MRYITVATAPGRAAFTDEKATKAITEKPMMISWSPYLDRLANYWGDIIIIADDALNIKEPPMTQPSAAPSNVAEKTTEMKGN